jgi:hypothetical protein
LQARPSDATRALSPTASGIAAALWLGGLAYASPAFAARGGAADRLRDALALGVAIPLVLAASGLLFPSACVALLAVAVIIRTRVRPPRLERPVAAPGSRRDVASLIGLALPSAAAVATSWPMLVRPLLQGDSLGYHLPNAAAWSVTHSLWTTGTWYWWYPGGSELFAAGLFTVAGPLAVSLAGFAALLLLAHRLAAFAERAGFSRFAGGAFAAAATTIAPIALQGGSLENDVWLAAWLLELVWALLHERAAASRALAVTGLLKPYGFLFAAVAAALGRARGRDVALGFAPIALWLARDAILWKTATIDPSALAFPNLAGTTIVAQGFAGIATLGSALWNAGPGMLVAVVALAATIVASREPLLRWTALGAFVFFLIEPFGFRNDQPQLATGASLRFALPALVLGLVGVLPLLRRVAQPLAFGCLALAAYQVAEVVAIFANDATTHRWYVAALVVAVAIVADALRTRGVATALAGLALVAYAVRLTGSHPIDYYDDLVARGNGVSHLFAWLANDRPAAVIGDHIRIGAIAFISPGTLVSNTVLVDPCGEARRAGALLVIADDPPTSDAALAGRRAYGRACGPVRYADGSALVVAPSPLGRP